MVVLILHPTEEIKLIKWRKNFIFTNMQDFILCPVFPLWIDISSACNIDDSSYKKTSYLKEQLKTFGKSINEITILPPAFENDFLISNVAISTNEAKFTTKLILAKKLKINISNKKKSEQKTELSSGFSQIFPMNLKIFRLGLSKNNLKLHATELIESIWIKKNN